MSLHFGLARVLYGLAACPRIPRQATNLPTRSHACSMWRPFSLATVWPPPATSSVPRHCAGDSPWTHDASAALQRRYKHGHKKKSSFLERIKKTASGLFVARHPHYRHKRYNKTKSQLNRLKGTFVLPTYMQRKLRKAGF